jgi:hypothetical protein
MLVVVNFEAFPNIDFTQRRKEFATKEISLRLGI